MAAVPLSQTHATEGKFSSIPCPIPSFSCDPLIRSLEKSLQVVANSLSICSFRVLQSQATSHLAFSYLFKRFCAIFLPTSAAALFLSSALLRINQCSWPLSPWGCLFSPYISGQLISVQPQLSDFFFFKLWFCIWIFLAVSVGTISFPDFYILSGSFRFCLLLITNASIWLIPWHFS